MRILALAVLPAISFGSSVHALAQEPPIRAPRLWTDEALADWATPLAGLGEPPALFGEEEYYAAPVDNLRTYPLYHPDSEPAGYRESLLARGPQPLIDEEQLHTKADWIEAGRRVFEELDSALTRTAHPTVIEHFTDPERIDAFRDEHYDVMSEDGVLLDYRWVVDHDGSLKVSLVSCAGCHTRLMPDGSTLPGAPSNYDLSDAPAVDILLGLLDPPEELSAAERFYQHYGVPWRKDDPHAAIRELDDATYASRFEGGHGAPPGTVFARFNGSPLYVARMADLRGIRDRRYLDTTATFRNRGPEDVARYGILVEFADVGVFGPHRMATEVNHRLALRPPDAAMYALGLYLYSLDPAPSPYPLDESARRGREVFEAENCTDCHKPPLYTNNKLVIAPGFDPPAATREFGLRIQRRGVDTDPGMALLTRKGTGFYRVPTLRGLWYRGLYEHSGSVESLEDWFDPGRLRQDYRPTGWRGPGVERRAVPGHTFGLELSDGEKRDLIAFLRTL